MTIQPLNQHPNTKSFVGGYAESFPQRKNAGVQAEGHQRSIEGEVKSAGAF